MKKLRPGDLMTNPEPHSQLFANKNRARVVFYRDEEREEWIH